MASYTWPGSLPQAVLESGYSETHGIKQLRTPTDRGPAKIRRVGRASSPMSVSFLMTVEQFDTFTTFVDSTIRGVARFGFPHPRTHESVDVRIVASGEGDLYQVSPGGQRHWKVTMNLEVLP